MEARMSGNMIRIAKVSDFEHTRMKSYKVLARPVGVFKNPDGSFRAMEVGCKHENADLTQGEIKGDIVVCPWHRWKYNLRTGECLWGGTACLRPYALEIRGEDIYISLRPIDPDVPDPSAGEW